MARQVRRVAATGHVAPDVAWERYADLDAWSTWAPQIRTVSADGRRLAVGRSGTVDTVAGLRVPFVVTAVDASAMTWSWIARIGPVSMTLLHDVTRAPGGTRAGLTLEGPAWLVRVYAPLAWFALTRLVRP